MIRFIRNISKRSLSSILILDLIISLFSTFIAYSIRLENYYVPFIYNPGYEPKSLYIYLFCSLIFIPIFFFGRVYDSILKYTDLVSLSRIIICSVIYGVILFVLLSIVKIGVPRSIALIQPIIFCFLICIIRINIVYQSINTNSKKNKNVIIYGAGIAGYQLLNSINQENEFQVKAFLDDDKDKIGKSISGLKVLSYKETENFILNNRIDCIIIAIPSLTIGQKRSIISKCESFNIDIRILPSLADLIDEKITINDIKNLNINDLIEREIVIDQNGNELKNKVILITGAGGSIGGELCKQIIIQKPKKIILLDNSEYNLYNIKEQLIKILDSNSLNVDLFFSLSSINNKPLLKNLFVTHEPDYVFHAAAYKHVDMVEENIIEALLNNFFGTLNVVELTEELRIKKFTLISSDKAVRPTSIMGATKRLSEMIVQAYSDRDNSSVVYSIVRFGNVLGSSGSVINKFNKQIEDGNYVTVTDKQVTRFFMTVHESVNLILQASLMAKGGEIFHLDMGKPIKIIDLARKMIELRGMKVRDQSFPDGDIEIKITGLKPGEKLYEELLVDGSAQPSKNKNIFFGKDTSIKFDELQQLLTETEKLINLNDLNGIKEMLSQKVLLKNNKN